MRGLSEIAQLGDAPLPLTPNRRAHAQIPTSLRKRGEAAERAPNSFTASRRRGRHERQNHCCR